MKVLLDASVIITGIHSKLSASQIILQLSQKGKIKAFVSSIILSEVVRNLNKKFPEKILRDFLSYLPKSNFKKIEFRGESEVLKFQDKTAQKDIHVMAAAYKAGVNYLVTLDKKHLLSLKNDHFPFTIITPGEFINLIRFGTQDE